MSKQFHPSVGLHPEFLSSHYQGLIHYVSPFANCHYYHTIRKKQHFTLIFCEFSHVLRIVMTFVYHLLKWDFFL